MIVRPRKFTHMLPSRTMTWRNKKLLLRELAQRNDSSFYLYKAEKIQKWQITIQAMMILTVGSIATNLFKWSTTQLWFRHCNWMCTMLFSPRTEKSTLLFRLKLLSSHFLYGLYFDVFCHYNSSAILLALLTFVCILRKFCTCFSKTLRTIDVKKNTCETWKEIDAILSMSSGDLQQKIYSLVRSFPRSKYFHFEKLLAKWILSRASLCIMHEFWLISFCGAVRVH